MSQVERRLQALSLVFTILVLLGLLLSPQGAVAPLASAQAADVIIQAQDMDGSSCRREARGRHSHP